MKLLTYRQTQGISRRKITEYINHGMVFVNNKKIDSYKTEIYLGDIIKIDGIFDSIASFGPKTKEIILFNKPKGYVVSKLDKNNKTIYEILPKEFKNYYYLGRLDKESHGLLILTNESKMVHEFSHPSNGITKEYKVELDKLLQENDIKKCIKGIVDSNELLKAKTIEKIPGKNKLYKVILLEGKNRHIRRMFASVGYEVIDLQRVKEGKWFLGNLPLGKREKTSI